MSAAPIHLLTHPGQLTSSAVVCSAPDAQAGTWDPQLVTCPACQGLRAPCSCGPDTPRCPACRDWSRTPRAAVRPPPPPPPARIRSEKAFQEILRKAGEAAGWLVYHPWTSLHSAPGYPDLTVVRGDRLLFAELKMPGKTPTADQQRWLAALGSVTQPPEVHVWYPADLAQALEIIS